MIMMMIKIWRKDQENGKCKETALSLLPFGLVLKPASFENYETDFS
jgi:hypothetical protein